LLLAITFIISSRSSDVSCRSGVAGTAGLPAVVIGFGTGGLDIADIEGASDGNPGADGARGGV